MQGVRGERGYYSARGVPDGQGHADMPAWCHEAISPCFPYGRQSAKPLSFPSLTPLHSLPSLLALDAAPSEAHSVHLYLNSNSIATNDSFSHILSDRCSGSPPVGDADSPKQPCHGPVWFLSTLQQLSHHSARHHSELCWREHDRQLPAINPSVPNLPMRFVL